MTWPVVDFSTAPPYQQVFDYVGGTTGQPIYIGWAAAGTLTSESKWLIRKFTYDANNQILNIQYANKAVSFVSKWDDRATLTYG